MMEMERLGVHLRDWRIILGLSQELVAERANISRSTLIKLEQGMGGKLENFLTVAKVLGVSDRIDAAVDPLNTDLGRARAYMLSRQRAPRRN
ncbi:helix-turn-helix domain-containing protein [Paeniglutamicibacter psychrophenolicus]|uniref:helix-turn-helix domain-containing protein n=1 Tax=Paeniglutamicibacter psychrophenolicus TaxID=257454 RepID=UPI00277FC6D3|nr:helix-turn-helix transcriptional regulator [Paeniglutamicibacter psychrophenolicus]MDQ0093448.1 transcriptional regulator with XRE-family HTH domain [Paeniglutamicibacter psychrophenolicus]